MAHEASHSIDAEAFGTENKSDTYKENREEYAQLIDDAFADKLDQEYASDGYDLSTITHQNSNTQVNSVTNQPRQVDKVLASNTEDYNKLDKSKGESSLVPGAPYMRWVALKGKVPLHDLKAQEIAQNSRIVALTKEKLKQYGADAVEMVENIPEAVEFLVNNPEQFKKLPGYVQQAFVQYLEKAYNNVKAVGNGLITNDPQAIEAQAQAESDLVADLTSTLIGAGIGKIAVSGGVIVVKETGKVAKAVSKAKGGVDELAETTASGIGKAVDDVVEGASKLNFNKVQSQSADIVNDSLKSLGYTEAPYKLGLE